MPGIHGITFLCRITVDGQFEFVIRAPMAGGMRAGAVREFDDCVGCAGQFGQVRGVHRAARIKMRVGNLDLNGIGHERGLRTLGRSERAAATPRATDRVKG